MKPRALQIAAAALTVIVLDQISKWYMLEVVEIASRPPIEVTSFFRLVMVWNQGVSFGMLNQSSDWQPYFLILVALIISTVLARLAIKSEVLIERIGYGMVIGGAMGNVIDRLRFGAVADFFYAHAGDLGWPAFNVADAAICLGVGLLLLMMLKHPHRT